MGLISGYVFTVMEKIENAEETNKAVRITMLFKELLILSPFQNLLYFPVF